MATNSTTAALSLQRIERQIALIDIRGTAPLIVHRWSEKGKKQMLDSQQGRKTPKEAKNPEADYASSMYRFDDGRHGFPVTAYKAATVKGGARAFGKSVK